MYIHTRTELMYLYIHHSTREDVWIDMKTHHIYNRTQRDATTNTTKQKQNNHNETQQIDSYINMYINYTKSCTNIFVHKQTETHIYIHIHVCT